ncbi:MAG: hypothetical protein AAB385_07255, partial [Planctomycetota bacterium]
SAINEPMTNRMRMFFSPFPFLLEVSMFFSPLPALLEVSSIITPETENATLDFQSCANRRPITEITTNAEWIGASPLKRGQSLTNGG